ncbi:hypothetical protein [Paenibacillus contaminans]|uniref:Bacterial Pleckstrin homology domain-containing protein n=1 Tax=Paenibacillus contaminans TaxID=450362 RepID=A0A329MZQ1_9BACL|nr:hypothetical protein [Paenibacillus contaminans]RAV22967.1 hypothetical protein DQG23_01820 [Paenibacillus contaminans]
MKIAIQPYYKVERVVTGLEQKTVVHDREMVLYPDKVVTKRREFLVADVFDMSYRKLGADGGILYLHTKQGVYAYNVKEEPSPFIEAYRRLM